MDDLSGFVMAVLDLASDKVEDRYGAKVAWWFTLAASLVAMAMIVGLIFLLVWILPARR
ncbi:hypothetical protein [Sphingomonas ginkgonis]|uniref:hypothetical protein n=1 Tax=Sphingomonas ginkgonis TaxID=2315330 RepID=UPI00163B2756|nr:hypothetical protein [Sphingomonas ginkgonis]